MESAELGPLLTAVPAAVAEAAGLADDPASQVYACLWSHADRRPGHVHFVDPAGHVGPHATAWTPMARCCSSGCSPT